MLDKECVVCQNQSNLSEMKITEENFPWFRSNSPQAELVWQETTYLCSRCESLLKQFEAGFISSDGKYIFGHCHGCGEVIFEDTSNKSLVQGAHSDKFFCEECFAFYLPLKNQLQKI